MATLEELKKQKISHLKLELPIEELKRLMEFWFNNPNSDYNIGKNFEALQQKHEKYLAEIDKFVQSKQDLPGTLAEVQKELEDLGRPQNDLAKVFGETVVADQSFVYSLDTLITGLQKNKITLERVISESDYPKLKPQFDQMLNSIQSWIDKTAYLKAFVLEAGRKRSLVFEITNARLELVLRVKFAELSGQALGNIRNQIDAILYAKDLLVDIENWWFNAAQLNGFGGGYLSKYLQFEKPLLIMRSDYAEGLRFERRIEELTSLPPATKAVLKGELKDRLDTLKAETDKVLDSGWQALLERQKFLVQERESRINSFPTLCKTGINEYKSKLDSINNLEDFREIEKIYRQVIESCQA
jgi:hypothetical protein